MKARSAKGEQTRLNIFRAARDLFHAQGVAATSPDQVITASGTGKGQFYYYFASKEGLVHAVLESYLEELTSLSIGAATVLRCFASAGDLSIAYSQSSKFTHSLTEARLSARHAQTTMHVRHTGKQLLPREHHESPQSKKCCERESLHAAERRRRNRPSRACLVRGRRRLPNCSGILARPCSSGICDAGARGHAT